MNCFLRSFIARPLSRAFAFIALLAGCAGAAMSATGTAGGANTEPPDKIMVAAASDVVPPTGGSIIIAPPGAALVVPGTSKSEVNQRDVKKNVPFAHTIKEDGIALPPGIALPAGCAGSEKGAACK